jgi:hypothetical protein
MSTVFFSWQTDRPPREGRNLIEKALENAVSRIANDAKVEPAVREGLIVDKDTKGVPGSPPIFSTILDKIDRASVFVGDLTMCGTRCDGRLTPNPNVLIEYGWALKSLGYFQVLTVMNDAHGEPTAESMPFDLAHLRFPLTYNLPDGAPDSVRKVEREQLVKKLETAVRGVFESEEFKPKLSKRQIREKLGEFLAQGQHLMGQCANEHVPAPDAEANKWAEEVENYLQSKLSSDYVARFRSGAGMPLSASSIQDKAHRDLWAGLNVRLYRLEQFLSELRE